MQYENRYAVCTIIIVLCLVGCLMARQPGFFDGLRDGVSTILLLGVGFALMVMLRTGIQQNLEQHRRRASLKGRRE